MSENTGTITAGESEDVVENKKEEEETIDDKQSEEQEEEELEEEEEEEEEEEDEIEDGEIPWYKDEYFWLGEETSDGYDWDDRSAGYRVKKVLNTNGGKIAQTLKVGLHVGWIPLILVLGMNHPVNGITPSWGDFFATFQ